MIRLLVTTVFMMAVFGGSADGKWFDSEFPLTPDPATCLTERVDIERLQGLLASPVAGVSTPLTRLPAGTPVDQAVEASVIAVITDLFSCLNAGDPLRAYAFYSDDYLRQILPNLALETLATPAPTDPDEMTAIIAIRDVRTLPDGRVAATVVLDPALIPVDKMFVFILREHDGRWLIDDVLDELEFSLP